KIPNPYSVYTDLRSLPRPSTLATDIETLFKVAPLDRLAHISDGLSEIETQIALGTILVHANETARQVFYYLQMVEELKQWSENALRILRHWENSKPAQMYVRRNFIKPLEAFIRHAYDTLHK